MALTFDPNAPAQPGSGVFGLSSSADASSVVLVPVPFEATTSYGGGASLGPEAILNASRQVDLFDVETGRPYEAGIAMLDSPSEVKRWNAEAQALARPIIDAGGDGDFADALGKVNGLCSQMNDWVYRTVKHWLAQGKCVGTIGGDHSVSYGAILAHAEQYPGLGILHVDAHADLRNAYEGFTWSHASIMYNVLHSIPKVGRLVQVALRDLGEAEREEIRRSSGKVVAFFDADLWQARFAGVSWKQQVEEIVSALPRQVYISFDIDGLDPTLCPGTGTPVPGGLSFPEASYLIGAVAKSGKRIVGFDLNEVAPSEGSEWDGNVGARLLYKLIGWAIASSGGSNA